MGCANLCDAASDCNAFTYGTRSSDSLTLCSLYTDCPSNQVSNMAGWTVYKLDSPAPTPAPTMPTPAPALPTPAPSPPPTPAPTPAPTPCTGATCSVLEDPHVVVFDGKQISLLTTQSSIRTDVESVADVAGDVWVV